MRSDVSERAVGRWHGILSALGVRSEFLRSKQGPCPKCGGKDRFRWDNKDGRGTFYCNNCGAGDGFALLMNVKGWDFKEAIREVESVVGSAKVQPIRPVKTDDECRRLMRERWSDCDKITIGDPVARYLRKRGMDLAESEYPKSLRFSVNQTAMVALMQDPSGKATMVHSTFLTKDGDKALRMPPRLMMEGTIAKGSAVRLCEYGDTLGIAEGIETALSASKLFGIPCWAALNEVLMQQWEWPQVKRIVVFGDNDKNYVGQSAAYALARKISLAPAASIVDVMIPETPGEDWNDVLLGT